MKRQDGPRTLVRFSYQTSFRRVFMPKDLIIVESPAKTRTLSQFLGSSYQVLASMGHVRDLPKSKLGVDVEQDFEPSYTVIPERKSILAQLKKAAKESRAVYLASD